MVKTKEKQKGRYIEARGARKTSVARVRLLPVHKFSFVINGQDPDQYFKTSVQRSAVSAPLNLVGGIDALKQYGISVWVRGGGLIGQSEAVRHGLARALTLLNQDWKKMLKQAGFLSRDPRMVERKKYGLKKARRAPQWSKR